MSGFVAAAAVVIDIPLSLSLSGTRSTIVFGVVFAFFGNNFHHSHSPS